MRTKIENGGKRCGSVWTSWTRNIFGMAMENCAAACWICKTRAGPRLRRWGAGVSEGQTTRVKIHCTALRFILSHFPPVMCVFSKENWHNLILMRSDQAITRFYYKQFILGLLMRRNYSVALLGAAENNPGFGVMCLRLKWVGGWAPFAVWVSVLHHRVWTYTDKLLLVPLRKTCERNTQASTAWTQDMEKETLRELFSLFSLSFKIKNTSPSFLLFK